MESRLDMPPALHNRVRELRLARGWTQQQLAEAVGVSRQSINSIERNRYDVFRNRAYVGTAGKVAILGREWMKERVSLLAGGI